MHGSLGHFKATLQRKKERKAKAEGRFDKKRLNYSASEEKTQFDFPVLKKPELEKVKTKIRAKIKKEKRLDYLLITIVLLVFVLIYFLLN
ncbi:hypothetical protein BFR04_09960 [Gaetbulibacter sp. 4G1]|nr:hypothetical protein [Gaetbulibacter sp. 4G1]PIA77748.1 hypothetical protein BFR04_09960 [Gaetbulibacter sp. 4G1]